MTDDFLSDGVHHGKLSKLRQDYPINFHSIGLNIGGVDQFDKSYLARFKELYQVYEPSFISDHLCWSNHGGKYHFDLLPVLKTKESLDLVVSRVHYLQDFFNRPLAIENITSYIQYKEEDFTETEFIRELCKRTDCYLLLDISNVLVNAHNFNTTPNDFLTGYPLERVVQGHMAGGFLTQEELVIDTHGADVDQKDVLLLKEIFTKRSPFPVVIERDANIPPFTELEQERIQIERMLDEA